MKQEEAKTTGANMARKTTKRESEKAEKTNKDKKDRRQKEHKELPSNKCLVLQKASSSDWRKIK